jgi:RNA polymerase sigma factor (TIGR02999 family)
VHGAVKRGGARARVPLDRHVAVSPAPNARVLAVDAALHRLTELDPRRAQIVELRFFGGLTVDETAEAMQLSPATVKREWPLAKAWLHREIGDGDE